MKTRLALLLLLTTALAFGQEHAAPAKPGASCCAETPAEKKEACCEPLASEPFSPKSLYQADAGFTTDTGRPFTLGELRGKPVVLALFFASCSYACPMIVTDMQAIRAKLPEEIRERAALVLVTFDTARDTPAVLATYRTQRALDDQWVLLHGNDDSIRELAALLGVKYKQEADGGFSHSNIITILNPQGEVAHQRNGLKGGIDEAVAALVTTTRG